MLIPALSAVESPDDVGDAMFIVAEVSVDVVVLTLELLVLVALATRLALVAGLVEVSVAATDDAEMVDKAVDVVEVEKEEVETWNLLTVLVVLGLV